MIRSQMAEGFAREHGSAILEVYSAGLRPTGAVADEAIMVMSEKGIDISGQRSNGLDEVPVPDMDYVVSLTRQRSASEMVPPGFRGAPLDWPIRDPLGSSLGRFREARDEIEGMVVRFIEGLWKK
jgi:protein-tyrosine-phosphatase